MPPLRYYDVPEVLLVHEFPSEEVRIISKRLPTVTKSPFPEVTPLRYSHFPEVLFVHKIPSEEVRIVPEFPTETKD